MFVQTLALLHLTEGQRSLVRWLTELSASNRYESVSDENLVNFRKEFQL